MNFCLKDTKHLSHLDIKNTAWEILLHILGPPESRALALKLIEKDRDASFSLGLAIFIWEL